MKKLAILVMALAVAASCKNTEEPTPTPEPEAIPLQIATAVTRATDYACLRDRRRGRTVRRQRAGRLEEHRQPHRQRSVHFRRDKMERRAAVLLAGRNH